MRTAVVSALFLGSLLLVPPSTAAQSATRLSLSVGTGGLFDGAGIGLAYTRVTPGSFFSGSVGAASGGGGYGIYGGGWVPPTGGYPYDGYGDGGYGYGYDDWGYGYGYDDWGYGGWGYGYDGGRSSRWSAWDCGHFWASYGDPWGGYDAWYYHDGFSYSRGYYDCVLGGPSWAFDRYHRYRPRHRYRSTYWPTWVTIHVAVIDPFRPVWGPYWSYDPWGHYWDRWSVWGGGAGTRVVFGGGTVYRRPSPIYVAGGGYGPGYKENPGGRATGRTAVPRGGAPAASRGAGAFASPAPSRGASVGRPGSGIQAPRRPGTASAPSAGGERSATPRAAPGATPRPAYAAPRSGVQAPATEPSRPSAGAGSARPAQPRVGTPGDRGGEAVPPRGAVTPPATRPSDRTPGTAGPRGDAGSGATPAPRRAPSGETPRAQPAPSRGDERPEAGPARRPSTGGARPSGGLQRGDPTPVRSGGADAVRREAASAGPPRGGAPARPSDVVRDDGQARSGPGATPLGRAPTTAPGSLQRGARGGSTSAAPSTRSTPSARTRPSEGPATAPSRPRSSEQGNGSAGRSSPGGGSARSSSPPATRSAPAPSRARPAPSASGSRAPAGGASPAPTRRPPSQSAAPSGGGRGAAPAPAARSPGSSGARAGSPAPRRPGGEP